MEFEKLICGDCNSTSEFRKGKRGSAFIEKLLWVTLFFPGIFYSIWRGWSQKKICPYCGSSFLFPDDSAHAHELLHKSRKSIPLSKN